MESATSSSLPPTKPGRKGDPRMHQAVRARLQNPALSLYDALREGGFIFSPRVGTDPNTATEASLCDSEGILLCQRKNQLSRRLRSNRTKPNSCNDLNNIDTTDGGESLYKSASSSVQQYELHSVPIRGDKRKAVESLGADNNSLEHPLFNQIRQHGIWRNDLSNDSPAPSQTLHHHNQQAQIDEVISCLFARGAPYDQGIHGTKDSHISSSLLEASSLVRSHAGNVDGTCDSRHQPSSTALNSALTMNDSRPFIMPNQYHLDNTNLTPSLSRSAEGFGDGNNVSSQHQPLLNLHAASSGSELISGFIINECRMRSALDNYRIESGFLFKKCMILAGFQVKQTDETDVAYLAFLEAIINYEKRRLGKLLSIIGAVKDTGSKSLSDSAASSCDIDSAGLREITESTNTTNDRHVPDSNLGDIAPWAKYGNNCKKSHDHDHDHEHSHSQPLPEKSSPNSSKCKWKGRHVHRLEGKCGHRAVIHKPDGGSPHVDFLVDGKIECYRSVKPTKRDEAAMWPSSYQCDEIMCSKSGCHENYFHRKSVDVDDCLLGKEIEAPKVLDISEIDRKSTEWNVNFFNKDDNSIDSTLLGLFNLGDS